MNTMDPQQLRVGWGDKTISLVGLHTIVVFVLVMALTWMGFLLYRSVEGQKEALENAIQKQTEQLSAEHMGLKDDMKHQFGSMALSQGKIADAMDAQTYLMTKSDKERQLYKLDMPDALRKRIR